MADEPAYLAQTGDSLPTRDWLRERAAEARAKGCTWGRASWDEERHLLLYEGWLERPADEGEPRWQMEAKDG